MERVGRPWDALPTLALVNIFCKSTIKDRMFSIPMVCTSWNHASRDPNCWVSMVPDSHYSPDLADQAFVKEGFVDPFLCEHSSSNVRRGVPCLKALIERAGGGAAITSLFISPFLTPVYDFPIDNDLLRLIAVRCPNLKHLSFNVSIDASEETILEVIRSCQKLELIDFSFSPYFRLSVLEEIGRCCLNLRGIRVTTAGIVCPELSVIAIRFPGLKHLNISTTPLSDKDLLTILSGCQGLQYLNIIACRERVLYDPDIIRACAKIPEFLYNCNNDYYFDELVEGCYLDEFGSYDPGSPW